MKPDRRWALLAVPLLMILGAILGLWSAPALSRVNYTVQMAELAWRDARGETLEPGKQVDVLRGSSPEMIGQLARDARATRERFRVGAAVMGLLLGLAVGIKIVVALGERRPALYMTDGALCLACARCFEACPVERGEAAPVNPAPASLAPKGGAES